MKISLCGIVLLLATSKCFSAEITYTYLVYRPSFTVAAWNAVKNYGYKNPEIGLKKTRDLTMRNTNYIMVSVTPKLVTEFEAIANAEANGKIKLLWWTEPYEFHDPVYGLIKAFIKRYPDPINNLPGDFARDWSEVVVSSE